MNFELILVLATLISGVIVGIDKLYFRKAREAVDGKEPLLIEYARSFFPVLFVVLLLRAFVAEPFRIPSGSMMPTLQVGDFILVNKFAYGLRLPVLRNEILPLGEPERGDVVVFKYPQNPDIDYIKRIIGMPGDRIRYENKHLFINGQAVEKSARGIYPGDGPEQRMSGAQMLEEALPDVVHAILERKDAKGPEGEVLVPEGHYFVMGDNRDNSNDSRYWGFVPEENMVGRAMLIWMHFDGEGVRIDPSRIGTSIQ